MNTSVQPSPGLTDKLFGWLFVFTLCSIIAVFWTYPLVRKLSIELVGLGGDRYIYLWNFWWFKKAFLSKELEIMFTPMVYYPVGTHLAFHSLIVASGFMAYVLGHFFSAIESYNLIFFLSFPIAGLTAFMLAQDVGLSFRPALVSGLVFGFWSGHWTHLDHLNQASIHFIPLFILFLRRWLVIDAPALKQARALAIPSFLTGLAWVINALSNWYYGIYLVYVLSCALIYRTVRILFQPRTRKIRSLGHLSLSCLWFGLGALIVLGPLYAPIFGLMLQPGKTSSAVMMDQTSALLRTVFLPNITHPVYGKGMQFLFNTFGQPLVWGFEGSLFFGCVPLVLAIIGFIKSRTSEKWFWLFVFAVFFLLALGPSFSLFGRDISWLMPVNLLVKLPFMSFLRVPSRFIVICVVVLALLSGWGARFVLERMGRKSGQIMFGLICLLILFDYFRYPTYMAPTDPVPKTYQRIGRESDNRAMLTMCDLMHEIRKVSYYQTIHQKPVTLGFTSHFTAPSFETFNLYAIVDTLLRLKQTPPVTIEPVVGHENSEKVQLDVQGHLSEILNEYGIGWVSLHPNYWVHNRPRNTKLLSEELGGFIESDPASGLLIFEVPLKTNIQSFVLLGKGFTSYDNNTTEMVCLDGATFVIINHQDWSGVEISFGLEQAPEPFSIWLETAGQEVAPQEGLSTGLLHYFLPLRTGLNFCELRFQGEQDRTAWAQTFRRWTGTRVPYKPEPLAARLKNVRLRFE
ncbi:hypothetical protein JXQ70_00020 [bacterium]|nr:hypothetical protein [bacterium]